MKSLMFQNYTQVVYFDTLIYGEIDSRAKTIADYLNLPLRIERVGLPNILERIEELYVNASDTPAPTTPVDAG